MALDSLKLDITPTVLHPIELASFLQHVIHRITGQVHLIICSSQDHFIQELLASISHEKDLAIQEAEAEGLPPQKLARIAKRKHDLLMPTLRQLANAKDVKVTFCETLPQLMAYLSVYEFPENADATKDNSTRQTIALLNPISLYRKISSFSAQGLSRTFASAVEAAHRVKARLLIVECLSRLQVPLSDMEPRSDDTMMQSDGNQRGYDDNPWDEEVSMLNVATKSFGAGERGWVGRTVKVRTVAERWCVFKTPAY